MTVRELIEALSKLEQDLPVWIETARGGGAMEEVAEVEVNEPHPPGNFDPATGKMLFPGWPRRVTIGA